MTYKQAYDKIIDAYFKDEIKPFKADFCFCGTLCNGETKWYWSATVSHKDYGQYKAKDFLKIERALLFTLAEGCGYRKNEWDEVRDNHPNYEAALFAGMSAALDVLKQIHIERGEVIDEVSVFVKRELA